MQQAQSIQLIYPFEHKSQVKKIQKKHQRLTKITFFGAPKNIILDRLPSVTYIKKSFSSFNFCGGIKNHFIANIDSFLESINHNSCLNKKIAIDRNGEIKNCPAMPQSFGNIQNISLEQVANIQNFKTYWDITKDKIDICKDCEFRYICTDCRGFTDKNKFENDIDLSKPLKCGYDPYKGKWEEWSKNPLKKKLI